MAYTKTDATLLHNDVNSNTAVDLNMVSFTYAWKNITKADPPVGQFDIQEADFAGFENPVLVIRGIIDTDDTTANRITQSLLADFAQADNSTNQTTLTITCAGEADSADTVGYLKGRPTLGYRDPSLGNTYLNAIKVQVTSFNIRAGYPGSIEGRKWEYTLNVIESKDT